MTRAARGKAPRLLLLAQHFAPGTAGGAATLAGWLAGRGLDLHVVAATPRDAVDDAGGRRAGWWVETGDGMRITRCPLRWAAAERGIFRRLESVSFALSSAPVLLDRAGGFRPDLVAGFAPPAAALPAILLAAARARARSWLHLDEDAVLGAGGLQPRLLRRFGRVSLAGLNAAARLAAAGIAEDRRVALSPWIDTRAIFPLRALSPLRQVLDLAGDAIVALYAGSLDGDDTIDVIIEAARLVPAKGAVTFVVCGRGAAWGRLAAVARGWSRLRLLPWPPAEDLNALLNLADIHLLPAGLAATDPLLPAKAAALLASGQPLLAAAEPQEIPRALRDAVVPMSGGAVALAAAVIRLAAAPAERLRRGTAARRAAQDYHEQERVFRQLERALALAPLPAETADAGGA